MKFAGKIVKKANQHRNARGLLKIVRHVKTMARLIKRYRQGAYRDISKKRLFYIFAGLLYFFVPMDAIPDFFLGFGFIDDAAVLGFILNHVKNEMEEFSQWENHHNPTGDGG